ncbi:hypothetical protein HSBAA_48690 [Vreelandella sulfidaeris]|uniref:Tyr recombinase domain-containing protein n=1 Tax=Vreelandella sulfidaeris TaxID=115553 RepID=A0A455UE33_9GAMM|nr:hypothetical protein HSBAA_48690 [Halomonas sulfidaeris]
MGRKPKYTFSEGLQRMVSEYDVRSQKQHILLVARWMDEHAPGIIIGQELLDATRRMQKALKEKGLAQSTINNRIQVVKRVLSLSYREWDWIDLPLDGKLRKPSPKNERHVYLSELELAELLEAVPERYQVERKVILLAMLTGMRRGELMALEPRNVYNGRIVLKPNQTKTVNPGSFRCLKKQYRCLKAYRLQQREIESGSVRKSSRSHWASRHPFSRYAPLLRFIARQQGGSH